MNLSLALTYTRNSRPTPKFAGNKNAGHAGNRNRPQKSSGSVWRSLVASLSFIPSDAYRRIARVMWLVEDWSALETRGK
jgi:hypothetical protein